MTVRITHTKVSGKPAGSDPDRVYGTHWDADHTVTGLDIGTDVQAYDADLAALAANSTNGLWARTASGEGAARTITGTAAEVTVTNGDGVSGNPTLSLPSTLTLTGKTVTVATQTARDNSTKAASTAYVDTATREKLTADRTYYVRTDGSDSNTGLANTSGGAFLTGQKAWDVVAALDLSIYSVTIKYASGTYTGGISMTAMPLGGSGIVIEGDTSTPANVHINRTSTCFSVTAPIPCAMQIKGFKCTFAGSDARAVYLASPGAVTISAMELAGGSSGYAGAYTASCGGAQLFISTGQTITGGMSCFLQTNYGGLILVYGITVTLTGTPAFSWVTVSSNTFGFIDVGSVTFSGSATGTRYSATYNGGINTNGGGASFIPGNSAGSTATNGWYN